MLLGVGPSCSKPEQAQAPAVEPASAGVAADALSPPRRRPSARESAPVTEEALVNGVADAIEARDLARLRALASPELAADLERLHAEDAALFWQRGQAWVTNTRSGFRIEAEQDNRRDRWRALIRFGNGLEETVVFGRVDKRLCFEQL